MNYTKEDNKVVLTLDSKLDYAKEYRLRINQISDIFSNTLSTTKIFTTKTILYKTIPIEYSINNAIQTTINIMFEGKIDSSGASLSLKDSSGKVVDGDILFKNSNAIFTPSKLLEFDTDYTVTISGIKDENGFDLESKNFLFTTELDNIAPTISKISPSNNSTDIALNTTITATFDEDIRYDVGLTLRDENGHNIDGILSLRGNQVSFKPENNLESNMNYSVIVFDIKDMTSNKAPTVVWSFTTK
jgi:methionine-rich copper-binding protein CopC